MDRDCQNGSLYFFVVYGNEAGNRFMGREKKGNLNNRTFLGWCGHAFDPRETRDRPAKNTRGGQNGQILIIVLFWVGIGECVERE